MMSRASSVPLPRLGIRRTIGRTRWVVALLWLVAVALTSLVWVHAIQSLTNPKPTTAQTRPQAFVWGDRVFETRPLIEAWLRRRGISYSVWAKRHPAALGIMYPHKHVAVAAPAKKTPPPAKVASSQTKKLSAPTKVASSPKKVAPTRAKVAPRVKVASPPTKEKVAVDQSPAGGSSGSFGRGVVTAAIAVLPFFALLLAAGSTWYARWKHRANLLLPMRPYLVAFAASIAAGTLIAHALS